MKKRRGGQLLFPLLLWTAGCEPGKKAEETAGSESGTPDSGVLDTGGADAYDIVLYVEITGADADNDCQDRARPCATPEWALSLLPGLEPLARKQVRLGAGSWEVRPLSLVGISHVALTGAGWDQTLLHGPFPCDTTDPLPILSVAGTEVVVEGLSIDGIASDMANGTGITVTGPVQDVILRDLRVDGRAASDGDVGALGLLLLGDSEASTVHARVHRVQVLGFSFKAGLLLKGAFQDVEVQNAVFYANDHAVRLTNNYTEVADPHMVLQNSIFQGNMVDVSIAEPLVDASQVEVSWNLFGPGDMPLESLEGGEGNLEGVDPLFRSAPLDFSLQSTADGDPGCSPAIDAGDPEASCGAEPEPNGARLNMGIRGGTAQASRSCSG